MSKLLDRKLVCTAITLAALLAVACGDGGGGGGSSEALPAIAGEWEMSESVNLAPCGIAGSLRTIRVAVEEDGIRVTVRLPEGTLIGSRHGNTVTWGGQYWYGVANGWITLVELEGRVGKEGINGSARFELRNTPDGPVVCSGDVSFDMIRSSSGVPQAPANFTASTISDDTIRFTWSDRSDDESGFSLYSLPEGGVPHTVGGYGPDVQEGEQSGFTPATTYRFYVTAWNSAGESARSNLSETTTSPRPAPAAPANAATQLIGRTWTFVVWEDRSNDETAFRVYRGSTPSSANQLMHVVGEDVDQVLDGPLSPDSTYYYRVSAVGPGGESDLSNAAEVETLSEVEGLWLLDLDVSLSSPCGNTQYRDRPATLVRDAGSPVGVRLAAPIANLSGALNPNQSLILNGATGTPWGNASLTLSLGIASDGRAMQGGGGAYTPGCSGSALLVLERPPAPPAPTGLVANATGSSEIELAWTDDSILEEEFRIERRMPGASWVLIAVTAPGTESYRDGALSANTTYEYRVFAWNLTGQSAPSNIASDTTQTIGGNPPLAPTNLVATALSSSSIRLTWTPPSDADRIYIDRALPNLPFTRSDEVTGNATGYLDSGLSDGLTYRYYVTAENANGESPASNSVSATTPSDGQPPAAPTNLVATAASTSQIDLTWEDNAGDETGFVIEVALPGLPFTTLETLAANVEFRSITGLPPEATRSYRIRAFNAVGNSAWSNSASATTLPAGSTETSFVASDDTYIAYDTADPRVAQSNHSFGSIWIGTVVNTDCSGGAAAALLHFDVDGVLAGRTIRRATLRLYANQLAAWRDTDLLVYAISTPWNAATVTQATSPETYIDYWSVALPPSTTNFPAEWDVTLFVQWWASGAAQNNGLGVYDLNLFCSTGAVSWPPQDRDRLARFSSLESYTSLDRRPTLIVEYE